MNLPLVSQGATPIDIIRRPPAGEHTSNSQVYQQRMYSQASLRILLSDRAADITGLPEIDTTVAPLSLDWSAGTPAGLYRRRDRIRRSRARSARSRTTPTFNSSSSTSGTSPNMTINVSSIPAEMRLPTLTVNGHTPITCLGKTAVAFLTCTGFPTSTTIPNNSAVTCER